MTISILGAGTVGKTLAKGWLSKGHSIVIGTRDPSSEKPKTAAAEIGPSVSVASIGDAAAAAEVAVLTTPWGGTEETVKAAAGNLKGKILLDVTNPLVAPPLRLAIGFDQSAGELVAQWAPEARVVKIFNTTGADNMADPNYSGQSATMLYAGDNEDAKKVAARLAADLGFDPVDAGPLASARYLEPFAMLWIDMALFRGYGTNFAFKLLTR